MLVFVMVLVEVCMICVFMKVVDFFLCVLVDVVDVEIIGCLVEGEVLWVL